MLTEEAVIQVLNGICGAEDGEIAPDMDLFEEGLLDSFGTIQLLTELEERFGVSLELGDISREQISTPLKIARLVEEAGR